jgi:hypothetical protein
MVIVCLSADNKINWKILVLIPAKRTPSIAVYLAEIGKYSFLSLILHFLLIPVQDEENSFTV